MKLFGYEIRKQEDEAKKEESLQQTRRADYLGKFGGLDNYTPLKVDLTIYDLVREAIPIVDVAITKLTRLIGSFDLYGEDDSTQEVLDYFRKNVRVNSISRGLDQWLLQQYDSTLAKGFAVAEAIPDKAKTQVYRLRNTNPNNFMFYQDKDGQDILALKKAYGEAEPFADYDYIYYMAFDLRDGNPQGYSLLYNLPFMAKIFIRIQQSIDNVIYRMGDPTGVGILKGGENTDFKQIQSAALDYSNSLTEVNRDRKMGKVRDIVLGAPPGGGLELKTLFADARLPDTNSFLRKVLEQILSKTGLPAYYFTLDNWSDRETMTDDQADAIIAQISSQRDMITPTIERVISTELMLRGMGGKKFDIEWDAVTLKDSKNIADTRFMNAQAQEKEIANLIAIQMAGVENRDTIIDYAVEQELVTQDELKRLGREGVYVRMTERASEYRASRIAKILTETNESTG